LETGFGVYQAASGPHVVPLDWLLSADGFTALDDHPLVGIPGSWKFPQRILAGEGSPGGIGTSLLVRNPYFEIAEKLLAC